MKTLEHTGRERIEATIARCPVCFVGMADTDGTPYVLPMNFGYRDGTLYFHSAQEGRCVSILGRNPRVCVTFNDGDGLVAQHPAVACSYRMRSTSVLAWGEVAFVEDPREKADALDVIMAHYVPERAFRYSDPALRGVRIWKVTIGRWSCKEFGAPHPKP